MDLLTRWIHVLATGAYLGSTLAIALVVLPAATAIEDPALQRRMLARALRPYNVLSVGALGVLVISGASGLADYRARLVLEPGALASGAFGHVFGRLVWKLSLTFVLINVATYLSFGLAHRLVRAELGSLPVEPEKQASMVARMRAVAWLGVGLAAWTIWVGLRLAP